MDQGGYGPGWVWTREVDMHMNIRVFVDSLIFICMFHVGTHAHEYQRVGSDVRMAQTCNICKKPNYNT